MSLKRLGHLFHEYFKPILDLDLYSEQMLEETITESKIDLDLSAGSTYTRVYMVYVILVINRKQIIHPNKMCFNGFILIGIQ